MRVSGLDLKLIWLLFQFASSKALFMATAVQYVLEMEMGRPGSLFST
jgi:hypothetical protein